MPRYIVESYSSGAGVDEARERARRTAELGDGVTYLRTIFLPADETVLHLFDAPSAETLGEAGLSAALPFQRIVVVVEEPMDETQRGFRAGSQTQDRGS
jgi:hypothetical protein